MDYFFLYINFFLFYVVLKFFDKKLVVLLMFEAMMIVFIFIYTFFFSFSFFSSFVMLILSLFMVLDSVFGICLLIHISRNSTLENSLYISI